MSRFLGETLPLISVLGECHTADPVWSGQPPGCTVSLVSSVCGYLLLGSGFPGFTWNRLSGSNHLVNGYGRLYPGTLPKMAGNLRLSPFLAPNPFSWISRSPPAPKAWQYQPDGLVFGAQQHLDPPAGTRLLRKDRQHVLIESNVSYYAPGDTGSHRTFPAFGI